MQTVSMSDLMTKFNKSVQPLLDRGEEVEVLDMKSGGVRCIISPPKIKDVSKVDWNKHWSKSGKKKYHVQQANVEDLVKKALIESRDEEHLFS
jgi:hypothetical protein